MVNSQIVTQESPISLIWWLPNCFHQLGLGDEGKRKCGELFNGDNDIYIFSLRKTESLSIVPPLVARAGGGGV